TEVYKVCRVDSLYRLGYDCLDAEVHWAQRSVLSGTSLSVGLAGDHDCVQAFLLSVHGPLEKCWVNRFEDKLRILGHVGPVLESGSGGHYVIRCDFIADLYPDNSFYLLRHFVVNGGRADVWASDDFNIPVSILRE